MLQITPHDDAIDGHVAIVHFGCPLLPPLSLSVMLSLQTLQEIGVIYAIKGQKYNKWELVLLQYILKHPNKGNFKYFMKLNANKKYSMKLNHYLQVFAKRLESL